MKFILKNKFILLFIISIFITLVITFSTSVRFQLLNKTFRVINHFKIQKISYYIKLRDFDKVASEINSYIDLSEKISYGKTSLFNNIYDITELATDSIISQDDYNKMEKVYLRLNDISKDIYKNHVWLAKSLGDNDIKKSIYHLEQAYKLSNSSEEVYRESLNLYFDNLDQKQLIDRYCENYFDSFFGGNIKNNNLNYLYGSNNEFLIFFNNDVKNNFLKFQNELNRFNKYEFNFNNEFTLKKISLLNSFLNGSKIIFKDFKIYGSSTTDLKISDLIFISKTGYILDHDEEKIQILNTKDKIDKIEIILKNNFSDLEKISFEMKMEKIPLTNSANCKK